MNTETKKPVPRDPVFKTEDGTWSFYDETWAGTYDGFKTEDEARIALRRYCTEFLGHVG